MIGSTLTLGRSLMFKHKMAAQWLQSSFGAYSWADRVREQWKQAESN